LSFHHTLYLVARKNLYRGYAYKCSRDAKRILPAL
jgi:hypothetical protein